MAETTNTAKFIKAFDAKNESHVRWLGKMFDMAESLLDEQGQLNIVREINKNPLRVTLDERDALDWPHIHFVLSASYAKEVLKGRAWVPPSA